MSILRVEQLEPRQLLSGGCFAPEPSPRPPADAGSPFAWVAERGSFIDFGHDRYGPDAWTWSQPILLERASPPVVIVRLLPGGDGPTRNGPTPVGSGPAARDESGAGEPGPAIVVSARGPAGTDLPHEAAVAPAPLARVNLQPATLLDLAGAAALRLALPALVAVAPPVAGASGRDEIPHALNAASPGQSIAEAPAATPSPERPPITAPELPPALSTVLSILPPADLAELERGLRHFVGQLESAGRSLLRPVERVDFWPWIVAAAAALAACEIARREVRSNDVRGPSLDSSEF
jgi:hypothetical protein